MVNKTVSLEQAVSLIKDGDTLALGGNVLHRAPMAACMEIVKQEKKNLKLIKTAGAMDVDMLCLADAVYSVDAGFVSYETEYSLALHYRKAVQEGRVKGNEHACYTVISALRAAGAGIPFMPVKGLTVSDLLEVNDYFACVKDPFSENEVHVVKAIKPDVAIIHVQKAERNGNCRITGPKYDDILMAKAARQVIVTAETVVSDGYFSAESLKADIPHFLVTAVVHMPKGAWPCSCHGIYDIDRSGLDDFKSLQTKADLMGYLKKYAKNPFGKQQTGGRVWNL